MSNKDLLKQAIAEAKTIREAAIANAKEALEETLTPHLKEMLAQKLQEMEEGEEEETKVMDENIYEAEEEEVEAEEGEEGAEEEGSEEEEELEIEDMSVEDLKDLIRDIVSQEVGHDESEEEVPGEEAPEGDMVSMDGDSEEIDINELLAELELEGIGKKKNYMEEELDENMIQDAQKMIAKYGDKFADYLENRPTEAPKRFYENLNEDLMQDMKDVAKKYGDAGAAVWDKISVALHGKRGEKQPETAFTKGLDKINTAIFGPEGSGLNKPSSGIGMEEEVSEELNEALKAVKILRNQLQEVNLLNAKLLYVNKVFKSNNLSEGQKVNVIAAFDKAETVKEVKLVFETVSKNVVAKPAALKEHRSFASKATGNAQTTAPKEILSEVSEQVARWQKLAGIIKS